MAAKKVVTFGLRYKDFSRQRNLFALRNNSEIEIVAEIAYDDSDEEIFFKRTSIEEGLAIPHDYVIVCGPGPSMVKGSVEEVAQWLSDNGFSEEVSKVTNVTNLTMAHFEQIQTHQLQVLKELVTASDAQIHDRNWLGERIYSYGINPFFKLAKDPEPGVTWSTCGILQVPSEFLDLCLYLSDDRWKGRIDNAIEVGVWRGASSYILAAILYRGNPQMTYNMVDIYDGLVHFDAVKEIVPSLKKCIPNTSADFAERSFDFCFIDADHSYDGMMGDYMNVGRYASKILVFHDIFGHEYDHLNGGTVRGWQEIKELEKDNKITEFTKYPDFWMGLGVVEKQ
ncbi:class I SAM-dependent methyltransferase [Butyrivibrio sp. AE2032]|uniref:class I SAM-dependent methyltransferase n=1 Tax=Butyrivibrio sp. AE2032 TaxID=1458463 RepID=UPI0005581719|nr:class I SAM-dependent methyltransferase [Butyrivibrio sp. AE2032]